jgi:hypothetical protein
MRYTKKEYQKYVKELKRDGLKPISFKDWKKFQPIADKAVGVANKVIKKHTGLSY